MGDRNLTLFAFHTHGETQFGPSSVPGVGSDESESESSGKSWLGSGSNDEETGAEEATVADEDESGGGIGALLVAIVVLAAIAMVAKKLSGSEDADVDVAESDDL